VTRQKTIPDRDIIRAGARVLMRVGPARFTLADVANEAGLSPATLLQRFGSKRGLILAFARAAAAEATAPFEQARIQNHSPLAALRAGLVGAARGLQSRQEVANSLGVLIDDIVDDEMRAAAVLHAEATEGAIRELLDAAMAAGEIESADSEELALSVQAAYNGAIIQWALRGSGAFEPFLARVLAPLLSPTTPTPRRSRSLRGRGR
jgi:AcrR family transcriptional regulator